jgi:hypothetical protein
MPMEFTRAVLKAHTSKAEALLYPQKHSEQGELPVKIKELKKTFSNN